MRFEEKRRNRRQGRGEVCVHPMGRGRGGAEEEKSALIVWEWKEVPRKRRSLR